ncbi:hypothetical protein ACRRTK_003452 [Alexandromys fortis]
MLIIFLEEKQKKKFHLFILFYSTNSYPIPPKSDQALKNALTIHTYTYTYILSVKGFSSIKTGIFVCSYYSTSVLCAVIVGWQCGSGVAYLSNVCKTQQTPAQLLLF